MSECVVRMEMPKESCHTCDARCVSDLYGYICGIERKNVMPFLGKKNRPDWCPIICQLPEGHGELIERQPIIQFIEDGLNRGEYGHDQIEVMTEVFVATTIVPAERSEHEQSD